MLFSQYGNILFFQQNILFLKNGVFNKMFGRKANFIALVSDRMNQMTKQVTLIDRLSSSSMRYSAVPASALVTCLVPEGFSKSLGASETREVTKSHHLQEIKSSSSSKTLTMYLCLGLLYLVPHFHFLCKLWLS